MDDPIEDDSYFEIEIKEEVCDLEEVHHVISNEFDGVLEENERSQATSWSYSILPLVNNLPSSEASGDDNCYTVELSSYEDNAVEEFPSNIDVNNQVGYHVIDGNIAEDNTNVFVCNTIRDLAGIKRKKSQIKKMQFKHECDICHQKYATARSLKLHKVRHLSPSKLPFKCNLPSCNFLFATKIEADRHVSRHISWLKTNKREDKYSTKIKVLDSQGTGSSDINTDSKTRQTLDTDSLHTKQLNSFINIKNNSVVPMPDIYVGNKKERIKSSATLTTQIDAKYTKKETESRTVSKSTKRKFLNCDFPVESYPFESPNLDEKRNQISNVSDIVEEHEANEIVENTDDTKLQCGLCGFTCDAVNVLRLHLKIRHNQEQKVTAAVACPFCPVTFSSAGNFRAHLLSHTNERPFACDQCEKRFIMKNRLVAHKRVVHTPKIYNCSHCKKNFSTIHLLVRHERVHTGEKPFHCCFCSFSCNAQSNLVKHIRTQHDKPNYTYKQHLIEQGNHKQPLPVEELHQLQQKGAEVASKYLAKIDNSDLDIHKLKHKVLNDKKEKEYKDSLKKQKKRRYTTSARNSNISELHTKNSLATIKKETLTIPSGTSDIKAEQALENDSSNTIFNNSSFDKSSRSNIKNYDKNLLCTINLIGDIFNTEIIQECKNRELTKPNCMQADDIILLGDTSRGRKLMPSPSILVNNSSSSNSDQKVDNNVRSDMPFNKQTPRELNAVSDASKQSCSVSKMPTTYLIEGPQRDKNVVHSSSDIDTNRMEKYPVTSAFIENCKEPLIGSACSEIDEDENHENLVCNPREVQNDYTIHIVQDNEDKNNSSSAYNNKLCSQSDSTEEYSVALDMEESSAICDILQISDDPQFVNMNGHSQILEVNFDNECTGSYDSTRLDLNYGNTVLKQPQILEVSYEDNPNVLEISYDNDLDETGANDNFEISENENQLYELNIEQGIEKETGPQIDRNNDENDLRSGSKLDDLRSKENDKDDPDDEGVYIFLISK